MNNLPVYSPIIIGKDPETSEEVSWPWFEDEHSTLIIVGASDSNESPREQFLNYVLSEIQLQQPSIYRITSDNEKIGVCFESDAISWSEELPDPPEDFEDRESFIKNRRFFSSAYFSLLGLAKGITRSDLLPPTSYRWHMEGPLFGYIRAINNLEDSNPNKSELLQEISALGSVKWFKSKEKGTVYHLDNEGDVSRKAMSFLRAVWSFWAMVGKIEEQQQMILVIEIPNELLDINNDKQVSEIISYAFDILRYLSYETTLTIVISSEMLYPAPAKGFRHKVVYKASRVTDFDLTDEDIKHAINPLLFELWDSGENSAGIHFDDTLGLQRVLIPRLN